MEVERDAPILGTCVSINHSVSGPADFNIIFVHKTSVRTISLAFNKRLVYQGYFSSERGEGPRPTPTQACISKLECNYTS